jgi:glycosyltransferase involved in cell wall biosynthesis
VLLHRPARPKPTDRAPASEDLAKPADNQRILVFIPVYNCERQIPRVLAQFENPAIAQHISEILVLDNGSKDGTIEAARLAAQRLQTLPVKVARNRDNYGLGGSHKSAFGYATEREFTHVVVLHGDDQGDIRDLLPVISSQLHWQNDCCLGSRFMRGSRRSGYSAFRVFGNLCFNLLYSIAAWQPVYDLGSGLNIYSVAFLRESFYRQYHDGLHFNCFLLLGSAARKARMSFFPISWREEDQVSNVRIIRQSLQTFYLAAASTLTGQRFLSAEHRAQAHSSYRFDVLHSNLGASPVAA